MHDIGNLSLFFSWWVRDLGFLITPIEPIQCYTKEVHQDWGRSYIPTRLIVQPSTMYKCNRMNRRQDGHHGHLGFEWDLWLDNRDFFVCWRTDLWNNHKSGTYLIVAVALWPELRFVVGGAGVLHVCFIEAPIYMYPRLLNAVAHVTNTSRTTRETNLSYAELGTEN